MAGQTNKRADPGQVGLLLGMFLHFCCDLGDDLNRFELEEAPSASSSKKVLLTIEYVCRHRPEAPSRAF